MKVEDIPIGQLSAVDISSPVKVDKAMYLHLFNGSWFSLMVDCIIYCPIQILKNSLYSCPIFSPWCRYVPTQHSHYMRNVWFSTDHCIHQATKKSCIGNIYHVLYLFLCLWTLCNINFCTYRSRNLDRFASIHVEML